MTDTEKKMLSCELYDPSDTKLMLKQLRALNRLRRFNRTPCSPLGYLLRCRMMKRMFAEVGEGCYIEPPFHSNWGGSHVHMGSGVYLNFGVTLNDDTHIYIGSRTLFGPNVTVITAGHPVLPELRARGIEYNIPVHIGKNCWIGAGAVILPGVNIGDNAIIGAGSVVTKDIPENVIAVGNPCRVLREINEHDREYYYKDMMIGPEWFGK